MRIQVIITFFICTFLSCSTSEPKLITVSDIYQIEVPGDMSTMTTNINEEASLQYANLSKEKYLMIIHEDKYDFMETLEIVNQSNIMQEFTNIMVQHYEESFNSVANAYDITFNGLLAKKIEITGTLEGIPLVWHTVLIEGEEYLYQICFWTLKSREDKHMQQLFNSAKTFIEVRK